MSYADVLIPGPSRPEGGGACIASAEFACQRVDLLQRDVHAAQLNGEGVRGVVAGMHQQPVQQIVDRVAAPASTPTRVPSALASSGFPRRACDRQFVERLHGDQHLDDACGRCRPWGSRAAMTSPESMSATSQASAETSSGTGPVLAATITPQPLSASPPTGFAGTGIGCGGSPAVGTSEESTAGGVETRYGQLSPGPGSGSAQATAGAAATLSVTAKRAAHRVSVREVPIETQSGASHRWKPGAALWLMWPE